MAFFARRRRKRPFRKKTKTSLWKQLLVGFVVIAVVVLMGTGIWFGTRISRFTISNIEVTGGQTISYDEVRGVVEKELDGSYVFLVPHRFAYTYPHDAILKKVEATPRIKDPAVTRVNGTTLRVAFGEYIPSGIWCSTGDSASNTPCMFYDATGYAFGTAPSLQGGVLMRIATEDTAPEQGAYALPSDILTDTERFIRAVDANTKFHIDAITYTKDHDLYYHVSGGGEFYVDPSEDVQSLFDNLESILTSDKFKHLQPGNFRYVDLRFGDKVYVNEELASASATPDGTSGTTTVGQ